MDNAWNNADGSRPRYNTPIKVIVFNPFINEKRVIDSAFRSTGRYDGVCDGVEEVTHWKYKEN